MTDRRRSHRGIIVIVILGGLRKPCTRALPRPRSGSSENAGKRLDQNVFPATMD